MNRWQDIPTTAPEDLFGKFEPPAKTSSEWRWTPRAKKIGLALIFALAVGLGLFFPWENLPWNNQPYCAKVVYADNGEIFGCAEMVTP